jgi:biopolymer transport protein ExbB
MNEYTLGFTHFLSQSTLVARFILAAMFLASLLSWGIIVDRLIAQRMLKRRSHAFLNHFGQVRALADLETMAANLAAVPDQPCGRLTQTTLVALRHYAVHGTAHLETAGGLSAFLTRILQQGIEEEAGRLERGLSILASIGATAPFVGLFGTVWGIYHALIAISLSGQGTLDQVAGPVGEALIMTAIGLAVAIPAVLAYNALIRRNRIVLSQLDYFAHELLTLTVTGALLERGLKHSTPREGIA